MKSFIKLTYFKKSELFEIFKIADSIEQYEGFLKGKTIVMFFHSVIAEEEGLFTFEDVAKTISDKMVRRHPHVFKGVKYASEEELHEAWAEIKKEEKKGREWEADYLEGALNEASELIEKAKERKGFKSK